MTYSCGIFESESSTLEEASVAKLDRVCRRLNLSEEDHLLEIGTGWGSLAIHAARHFGCRVTTTTISREQYSLALQRIQKAGLDHQIEVLQKDYRDLSGAFDKVASIEMIEAVGYENLPTFFRACSDLLKPTGQMLLQAITISDQRYEGYRRSVDFIQRYVFPGSCLTAVSVLSKVIAESTDLRVVHLEEIGPHYARTLASWRRRFNEALDEVRRLGYDERFIRLWNYYLSYCEAGFAESYLGDVQVLMHKPESHAGPAAMRKGRD